MTNACNTASLGLTLPIICCAGSLAVGYPVGLLESSSNGSQRQVPVGTLAGLRVSVLACAPCVHGACRRCPQR